MFRVECSSCKAPYQVDERRVPKKGLTMKCPKCQVSFLVSPPEAPAAPLAPVAIPVPRADLRGTMIGVSAQTRSVAAGGLGGLSSSPSSAAASPSSTIASPSSGASTTGNTFGASPENRQPLVGFSARRSARNDDTMIGIAPERPAGTMSGMNASPPVRQTVEGLKVSDLEGGSEANTKDTSAELPALRREAAKPDLGFAPLSGRKLSRINLPSLQSRPAGGGRASTPPQFGSEAPNARAAAQSGTAPGMAPLPPSTAGRTSPASASASTSNPYNLYKPTHPEMSRPDNSEVGVDDLPVARTNPRARPSDDFSLELDLPSIRAADNDGLDDAPASIADLPEVPAPIESDLPAALGGAFSATVSDKPPAIVYGKSPVYIETPAFGETSRSQAADSLVDLDSEGVSLESLPPSDPPSDGPDLPEVAVNAGLPMLSASGLPSRPAPNFEDAGLGFGELDLPPLDSLAPLGRESGTPDKRENYTATEPPDLRTSGAPASFRARQDSFGDFDGLPSFDEASLRPPPVSSGQGDSDDELYGDDSLSLDRETPHPQQSPTSGAQVPSTRETSGRAAQGSARSADEEYGHVHLESGSSERSPLDDEMEFGGIPQAESDRPAKAVAALDSDPVTAERTSPQPVALRNARPSRSQKSGKKRLFIAAAVIVPLIVGGGALSLEPRLGPFGIHAIQALLNRGEHEALLKKQADMLLQRRAMDQYATAVEGVALLEQTRLATKRYLPLQVAAAEAHLSLVLRFGGPASSQSAGQVLLSELRALGTEPADLRLANAVEFTLQGDVKAAAAALSVLPKNVHAFAVAGEYWLRVGDSDKAVEAWVQAVDTKRCPWTLFGLARAHFSASEYEAATTAAQHVLEGNSLHAGAKLLLVELALAQGTPDQKVADLLNEVNADSTLSSPTELALTHTLKGELELAHGRTGKALEALEQALVLEPNSVRALNSSGRALFASGRFTTALARYQAAHSLSPKGLASTLGVIRSQIALQQIDKAKLELAPLSKADPTDLEVASLMGAIALAEGENESAQKLLRDAVERAGSEGAVAPSRMSLPAYQRVMVDAYVTLATAHTRSGQPEQATAVLQQAMKQLPGSAPLRIALGDVSLSQGHFEKALADYSEARQLAPQDVEAVFKVGSTLRRLQRFADATAVLERVAKMDPEYPGLALERGLLLEQSGKSEAALVQYEQALKSTPNDGDIQLRVGCGRMMAGNGSAAEEILEQLIKTRPRSAEVQHCLGRAHFAQGNHLEALRWLRSAVELEGARAEYRLYAGWVANELGQVPIARAELNRALELDQSLVDGYWQRGVLNLKQGAYRDATYDFKKALTLAPDNAAVNAEMGFALGRLGREGEAIGYWEKAVTAEKDNPVWLFRYGQVLIGRHHNTKAAALLRKAIELGNKQTPPPVWLSQAHYLVAIALKPSPDALEHWWTYLQTSPKDSVFRAEAKRELARGGRPWDGE